MIKPLYKAVEPFMEVKSGYGYQGVLLYDDIADRLQCHTCGEWYRHLGAHIRASHKIHADDYKIENGLLLRTALCVPGISEKRKDISLKFREQIMRGWFKSNLKGLKHRHRVHARRTMMFKNKHGLCDAQMKARYLVVKNIIGHEPSGEELEKHDSKLAGVIKHRRRGGLNAWKSSNGFSINGISKYWKADDLFVIAGLRK